MKSATILMVDDEVAILRLLERILRRHGVSDLHSTTDSLRATSLFDECDPDLVILDLHMPGMDGYDLLEELAGRSEDFVPIVVLTGDVTSDAKRGALGAGASDFVHKPFDTVEVLLRIRNLLQIRTLQMRLRRYSAMLEEKVELRTRELEDAQNEALELLALAAEYRDDATGQHTRRVGEFAARLAEEIGLDEKAVQLIRRSAPLHDLGKIGIPDGIMLKEGAIDQVEREVMQTHTAIGSRILGRSGFPIMRLAAEIAACHHERWDGTGYPKGIAGGQIPIAARIVALADVFDSLVHERPYKHAWTVEEAIAEILSCSGSQFDPQVVDAFMRIHGRGELPVAVLREA